jgi:uncharacterized protein with HEPN domain
VPSSDPIQRFEDILENVERIERFTAGMEAAAFVADEQAVFAVKHALLIISEAARKLGAVAEEFCPSIAWADIRGLGNRLRHEYDAVDLVRIWFLVERDLQPLKDGCRKALRQLGQSSPR